MYIKRSIEAVLKRRAANSRCMLLVGPRQVGKSTLLKKVFPEIRYVTFDDKLLLATAVQEPKLFLDNLSTPCIIDEVQYAPQIFPYIKIACDNGNSYGNYYLTGSQQINVMKNAQESLAGRVSILELQGLSMREICGVDFNERFIPTKEYIAKRQKGLKPYKNVWYYIHKGSYPELYVTEREWADFYSSYVRTYLERDIKGLIDVKDEIAFVRFLTAVAARTGQLLNYTSLAEDAGVTLATAKAWTSVLERTGLIYILQPYYSNHLTRAIKTPKVYFRDTGLACYLSRWTDSEALAASAVAGNMFETFVVSEILKSFTNEGREYQFSVFYYRGKDKRKTSVDGATEEVESEIDLIIEENGTLYPIEIKKTANPNKNMATAFDVLDKETDKKRGMGAIVCLYDDVLYLKDDLIVLPIEYI